MIKKELLLIGAIYLATLLVNTYKLPEHFFFGHEQGRDAAVIKDLYTFKKLTLIGPKTEIAGVFTPPWYFWLMTIPYGLAHGNPQAAGFFLAAFNSTVSVIIYFLIKEILKSKVWATGAAVLAIFSFELISYARWLSNVTPAIPATAVAIYFSWRYSESKNQFLLIASVSSAILASLFQVVLIFQFLFVYLLLLILKIIAWPKLRSWVIIFFFLLLTFLPLIIFDFRHDHITLKAIGGFVNGSGDYPLRIDLLGAFKLFLRELSSVAKRTLFNLNNTALQILFFGLFFWGIFVFGVKKNNRTALKLIVIWSLMAGGILIFNIGLTQLYIGTALGWIGLLTLALQGLWQKQQLLTVVLFGLLVLGWMQNLLYLHQNRGMFFKTIQESINWKDQTELLSHILRDAGGSQYRLEAQTVPYLHAEGWQYLSEYFCPGCESKLAKVVYIIIEKNVELYWENKWIADLGESRLVEERKFGGLRLQKRLIISQSAKNTPL